jgi:thiol-disulfide isomerase/thioredoxin
MKKLIFLIAFYICALSGVYAQVVSIGDDVSDLELKNVWNYPLKNRKLSELKGKLVIFDFWGFNCPACFRGFPEMEKLQARYKDKIQIILVNNNSKKETVEFFSKKQRFIKKPSLPMISGDIILERSFPHNGVPFHVWIDDSGRVRYFTHGYNTSIETVGNFLNGREMNFAEYNRGPFAHHLFDDKWEDLVQYSSVLTKPKVGVALLMPGDKKAHSGLGFVGHSVVSLYQKAYNEDNKYAYDRAGRTILEFIDSSKYKRPAGRLHYDEWTLKYCYNYQLLLPKEKEAERYEIMQSDLSRFFDITATVEERMMSCLVLVRTSTNEKLATAGGKRTSKFYKGSFKRDVIDSIRYVTNLPFNEFIRIFSLYIEYNFKVPFFNETGYVGNIDIAIDGSVVDSLDLDLLRKSLQAYDLDLIVSTRPVKVLVLKDRQKQ